MKGFGKVLATVTALAVASFVSSAFASTGGSDNAADAAYSGGWTNGTNGGTGFSAWTLSGNDTHGWFIGDSTGLSTPGADINVSSKSFGTYGANPGFAAADRSFDGGGLSVGQTFSVDLAVNFRNGFKGIDVKQGGTTLFNFNIGGDDYTVSTNGASFGSIGNSYSSITAFHLAIAQTSAGGGTWTITRSGGVSDLDSGTYTGDPDNIRIYVGGTDGGSPNDLYANNLSIVPEPSTVALVGLSLLGVLTIRRRS